jgi:predicted amino acid dehydrogenase
MLQLPNLGAKIVVDLTPLKQAYGAARADTASMKRDVEQTLSSVGAGAAPPELSSVKTAMERVESDFAQLKSDVEGVTSAVAGAGGEMASGALARV